MKKIMNVFMILILMFLVVACSNKDGKIENPPDSNAGIEVPPDSNAGIETPPTSNQGENIPSQTEVLKAIKEGIKTDLTIKLPSELPLAKGEYLTAITTGDKNSYTVVFYKANKPIPINNENLGNDEMTAKEIGVLMVEKSLSQNESDEKISFEDFSISGGQKIELGYKIIGFQDAGAGSAFTNWNEGRWALTTRSLTSESDKGVELAKRVIEYLEKNTLPIPKQYGKIHLDTEQGGNLALWQDGKIVYTIDKVKDPMDMLKIMVSIK